MKFEGVKDTEREVNKLNTTLKMSDVRIHNELTHNRNLKSELENHSNSKKITFLIRKGRSHAAVVHTFSSFE